jgi:hypothetical protein
MKKVLLYSASLVTDKKWANQFVAYDNTTRVAIDTGGSPDWTQMLGHVKRAASQAGSGGVVMFLSGHGVEADSTDASSSWVSLCNGGKVKLNPDLVFYATDPDGKGPGKSKKEFDDAQIKLADSLKTSDGRAAFLDERTPVMPLAKAKEALAQEIEVAESSRKRRQLYENYKQMGSMLSSAGVTRVVFLACNIGKDTKMIDQIGKDWGVEVVAYKQFITLQEKDGKVRIFLSPTRAGNGNVREDHDTKFIPDITVNTAHVAHP